MIKNFLRESPKFWDLIFLTSFSFFTRFFSLFYPSKVVFDEAHFGLYATKYLSHQYFFDIHPPLGKLLLASVSFLGKVNPGFAFEINSLYPTFNFLAIRFLPTFFGALLVALIYLFVREIGFSRRAAFFSGFLALFDNALLVQSRFTLLDIILVFFIFLALYLFLLIKKHPSFSSQWYLLNFLCGLVLGGAISVKWTGFGVLGIIWFLTVFNQRLFSRQKKEIIVKTILIFLLPLFFYFFIFALHFYLTPLPCQSDCGVALSRSLDPETNHFFNYPPPGNMLNKFKEVHKSMLGNTLTNSYFYYQSDWWSWPFLIRPVKYFQDIQGEKISTIYLLGNPMVWWLSTLGVLGYLYLITKNYFLKFKLKLPSSFYSEGCFFLFLSYLIYTLSFFTIKRYVLIYHYLPALVFAIIIFAVFFEGALRMIFLAPDGDKEKIFFANKKANLVFCAVLILIFLSFLFFSPLSYGFPLTEKGLQARMWLDTWSF